MRVVGYEAPGGPEVLRVLDVPEPQLRPGHVKIRVRAASVSPSDVLMRSGATHELMMQMGDFKPPFVAGWDAAGVVEEADSATGWKAGDKVIAITLPVMNGPGAYSEKIVVPADSVTALPAGHHFAEASTLLMNGLTALQAVDLLASDSGGVVVVTGGAGAVGGFAIPLAKRAGLTVIADAKPDDKELIESFGADIVVERGVEVVEQIRKHFPGGVDGVIDGAILGDHIIPAIRSGGAYVALRPPEAGGGVHAPSDIMVHVVLVAHDVTAKPKIDKLSALAAAGDLKLRVAKMFRPDQAADAHRMIEAGGFRGRAVLQF